MTALHRVKAYFGMVPADELDAYDGYDGYDEQDDRYDDDRRRPADRYGSSYGSYGHHDAAGRRDRREGERYDGGRYEGERYEDRDRYSSDRHTDRHSSDRHSPDRHEGGRYESGRRDGELGAHTPRPRDARDAEATRSDVPQSRREESRREESRRDDDRRGPEGHDSDIRTDTRDEEPEVETSRSSRGRSWAHNTGPNHTSVRPTSVAGSRGTPSLTPIGSPSGGPSATTSTPTGGPTRGALAVDPQRDKPAPAPSPEPEGAAPAEITSLQPTSYNEARVIGERYRDGIPVIMNLTDMDEVAAKRLVDFAAGLAFALRGSIEKVTSRVFLLSPPNVEVSAAERRKLAENSYSASS